jgi:hypothetical protein
MEGLALPGDSREVATPNHQLPQPSLVAMIGRVALAEIERSPNPIIFG